MITGTIKSAVKLNMLTQKWEQKKNSGNVLSKQERNERANWTPEQRMLNQFQEEMEQNRIASKDTEIANKIIAGDTLTPEEEKYLAQKDPAKLNEYRKMKAEKKAYEDKLKNCRTKDEVQRLKTNTINGCLSELKKIENNPNIPLSAKCAKAQEILARTRNIQAAEIKFIESGRYSELPTEAEEAVERAEETREQNEEIFEEVKESAEPKEDAQTEAGTVKQEDANAADSMTEESTEEPTGEKASIEDAKEHKHKIKKETSDALKEIEDICSKYIRVKEKTGEEAESSLRQESSMSVGGHIG